MNMPNWPSSAYSTLLSHHLIYDCQNQLNYFNHILHLFVIILFHSPLPALINRDARKRQWIQFFK